jgi:hypothetical protein
MVYIQYLPQTFLLKACSTFPRLSHELHPHARKRKNYLKNMIICEYLPKLLVLKVEKEEL